MDLPQTRASLLIRLRDRSGDAWQEFLLIYERALVDFARRKGLQDADARDVTQEVLTAVERKVTTWRHDPAAGRFRGWLFRVARNTAVDRVVEQARALDARGNRGDSVLLETAADGTDHGDQFDLDYCRQLMSWAADKVRPSVAETSWKAFWMTAVEGRDGKQVARDLGLSRGAVYAAKFRIIARIRAAVDQFDDPDRLTLLAPEPD